MIRVNLLRDSAPRTRKITVAPTVSRTGLAIVSAFILLVGGLGFWWFYVDRQVRTLTETRDRLRVENARLQALKQEIVTYEKLKKLRQSRVDVIEKLKEFQSGPVALLNDVIRSIPHEGNVWLTVLDQKGDKIQIAGYAQRGESIPDFMSNLAGTGYFESVDLEVVQEENNAAKFSLMCLGTRKLPAE